MKMQRINRDMCSCVCAIVLLCVGVIPLSNADVAAGSIPPPTPLGPKFERILLELGQTDLGADLMSAMIDSGRKAIAAGYRQEDGKLTAKWQQDAAAGKLDVANRPVILSGGPELATDAESYGIVRMTDRLLTAGDYVTGEAIDPVSVVYREIKVQGFNAAPGVWLWKEQAAAKIENRIRATRKFKPRTLCYDDRAEQMIPGTDGKRYSFTVDVDTGQLYESVVWRTSKGGVINLDGKPAVPLKVHPGKKPVRYDPRKHQLFY